MYKAILILLLLSQIACQLCTLSNCDTCKFDSAGDPQSCTTCHGWYESSSDTGFCVLGARLIILTIVMGLLLICVIICAVLKYQEYTAKYTERPTNIQSFDSTVNVSDKDLSQIRWNTTKQKMSETSRCNICNANGSTIKLRCGHVFHGDCICWALKKAASCPTCHSAETSQCRIHCLKCMRNYLECPPQFYVEIKKRKSRVCFECQKGQ